MSLLTDDEIEALAMDDDGSDDLAFARAIESALLAKLGAMELPEPIQRDDTEHGVNYYTAAHLQQARAQGFAAGAAAQLAEKPSAFTDADYMSIFVSEDIAKDCGATIELYTRREA
jgi:hypothetical protein